MRLRVCGEEIPCEIDGFVSQPESKYFGWYVVRFEQAAFDKAAAGQKTGLGFGLETDSEGMTKALVKSEFVLLDD